MVHPHPDAPTGDVADVEIAEVTKRFGDVVAVDQMSLRIGRGQFYSLLGPSGCGKTTTLRMIAGFEQPTAGEIFLDGQPVAGIPPYRRNVNTVFQHYALFPHMTVAQNVGYGLRQKGIKRDEEKQRVAEALQLVRLANYGSRRTWELSGGQQQRVALARALINHPTVLLLDEPLGALDRKLRHEMQLELKQLQQRVGITFVYVTHDQEEALTMSDVIVVMSEDASSSSGVPRSCTSDPRTGSSPGSSGRPTSLMRGSSTTTPGRPAPSSRPHRGSACAGRDRHRGPAGDRGCGDGRAAAGRFEVGRASAGTRLERRRLDADPGSRPAGHVSRGFTEYRIGTEALGDLVVRIQNSTVDATARTFGPGEIGERGLAGRGEPRARSLTGDARARGARWRRTA